MFAHLRQPAYTLLFCSCFFICAFVTESRAQIEVAPPAKSDTFGVTADGKKERIQRREIAKANFRISGVDLTSDEEVLPQAAKVFGKASVRRSGDASTGIAEACYQSAARGENTYLIFGRGEVDNSFTLSSDVSGWEGGQTCKRSEKVTRLIATDSGLRLGLTKRQVLAVLGLATEKRQNPRRHAETLIYSLEATKQTDAQKLARWWQEEVRNNPAADHNIFLENYGSYTLEVYVTARFVNDSLARLYVDWSEQY